jgi:hypothetical protein
MYFPWNWEFGSALSKLHNFGGAVWTPTPGTPLLTFTYFQKFLTTKYTQWIFITLRNPAFENKAERSLSQHSSYLPLGAMCRSENPAWDWEVSRIFCVGQTANRDQTATTPICIAYQNGSLPWELARCCKLATYYLGLNISLWFFLWNSNEPTGNHFSNHNIYLYIHPSNTA